MSVLGDGPLDSFGQTEQWIVYVLKNYNKVKLCVSFELLMIEVDISIYIYICNSQGKNHDL